MRGSDGTTRMQLDCTQKSRALAMNQEGAIIF